MSTETDLRAKAQEHVRAGTGLIIDAAMYVAVNLALVALWAVTGRGYPWFAWPMLLWGVGVIGHGLAYKYGPGSASDESRIEREVSRLRTREQH